MSRTIALFLLLLPSLVLAAPPLDPADEKALRELEQQVTNLKTDVHESKARMQELEEAVLRGKITGSKAYVTFENQAEGFFALATAEFFVDGELTKSIVLEKGAKAPTRLAVFDNDLPPGEHVLEAKIRYQGSDKAISTMFSYFKDHKFIVETKEKFPVDYGKTTHIKLTTLDRDYFKTDLSERLALDVQVLKNWGTELPE